MKKKKLSLCVLTLVLSLIACVTVLEAPKVFAEEGSALGFSDSMEATEYADTYNTTWVSHHNCYAFALGRIKLSYNETSNQDSFCEIGGYCGNVIDHDTATTSTRLARIQQDLDALDCTDVTVGTTLPTDLADGFKLICYREGATSTGDFDYHFMRYDAENDKWLHKPGEAGRVMTYNYTPSNDRVWTYSYAYGNQTATVTYNGTLYYISYKETIGFNETLGANIATSYTTLNEIRNRYTEDWCLGCDISLYNDEFWVPIENFSGTFYGNGYAIYDMRYRGVAMTKMGLFGVLAGGRITGLHLRSAEFLLTGGPDPTDPVDIGAIAAINEGQIDNCIVGASRTYSEVLFSSNRMANVGGITGTNRGVIYDCTVQFFTVVSPGNAGGIAGFCPDDGTIASQIYNCTVKNSEMNIYAGTVGGIVGHDQGLRLSGCNVLSTNISCYNGFPTTSSGYYKVSHYGYAGGIAGWHDNNTTGVRLHDCSITNVALSSGNESVDSSHGGRSFAPEIGFICGRAKASVIQSCTYDSASTVTGNNLHTETWGFWPWNYSWNQAQYVGSRLIGHAL